MDEKAGAGVSSSRKARSKILYQITCLIVVVLFTSGLVTFFLVRNSQDRLIEESIDMVIETVAEDISSTLSYLTASELAEGFVDAYDREQIFAAIAQKEVSEFQRRAGMQLKDLVDAGIFDLEYMFILIAPSAFIQEPFVMFSSDESMIYDWEIPAYLKDAMAADAGYLLMQEGLPELGLEGAHMLLLDREESPLASGVIFYFVSAISMQEKIGAVSAFYDEERGRVSLTLLLSVFLSVAAVVLIIFFVLSYLIRKRITKPIDELAAAAEQVMEGNLDVDIEVHEGGEFVGLERAFKEMVESFRRFIAASTGEDEG